VTFAGYKGFRGHEPKIHHCNYIDNDELMLCLTDFNAIETLPSSSIEGTEKIAPY
jgi:hypothetical protein